MLQRLFGIVLVISLVATVAGATSFDLAFNNESVQVALVQPLQVDELGSSQVGGRFLYNDDEETKLGSLGLEFVGEPGNIPGLTFGIGAMGYGGSADQDQDLLTAAIGGSVQFAPPPLNGFVFGGRVYFAPKIFSGLDNEGLLETALQVGYKVTPKVRVYLGYQNIRADFEGHDTWTIDDDVRLGFEAHF